MVMLEHSPKTVINGCDAAECSKRFYLEGVECGGKTTVGSAVAEYFKLPYFELMLNGGNAYATKAKTLQYSDPAVDALIFRSIIYDLCHNPHPCRGIQISFAGTRSVMHQYAFQRPLRDVYKELINYTPHFAQTIILWASPEERKERLRKRIDKQTEYDLLVTKNPEIMARMDEALFSVVPLFGATVLDTSNLNQDEVVQSVIAYLESSAPKKIIAKERQCPESLVEVSSYMLRQVKNYEDYLCRKHLSNENY